MNRFNLYTYFLAVCRVMLIGLIWVAGTSWVMGQHRFIALFDQVDLQKIEGARITYFDQEGELLDTCITNTMGRCELPVSFKEVVFVSITHPDYLELIISRKEIEAQFFRLFLESQNYHFNEVVFTANKYKEQREDIPYEIDVIDAQEIQLRNPQTSADLLSQEGSVFVQKSQMGGGSPNLRGFEANKVLLVVDGIRMNNAIYRSGHLQNVITIDPAIVDRTEVMFGPGSVMYGSDALGGVMHFYTREPKLGMGGKLRFSANAALRYGTANQEKTAQADINFGLKKWGFLTSFSVSDFGNLSVGNNRRSAYPDFGKRFFFVDRINGRDSVVQNQDVNEQLFSGYTQYNLMQKIHFIPGTTHSHTLNLQYSTTSDIPRFDRLTQRHNGSLRFAEWNYGPQERLLAAYTMKLYGKSTFYDQINIITAFQHISESRITRSFNSNQRGHREESVKVLSINLDANKVIKDHHELAYGLEGSYNRVNSEAYTQNILSEEQGSLDTRYPDGGSDMQFLAAYFTHRWEINRRWMLTDGIRLTGVQLHSQFVNRSFFPFPFDKINQHSSAVSGNLGAVFQPGNGWRFAFLSATGFRAPNLDDVAKIFDSQPGNVVVPNPDLKPEFTFNNELTIGKRWGESAQIELTGFYTRYTDAIVVRNAQLNGMDSIRYEGVLSQVQTNLNAGEAFITGFNANFRVEWDHLSLFHTMTYTYGQELTTDVPMDHIPPFFGKTGAQYTAKRFKGELNVEYNGWKRPERYSPRDWNNVEFATVDGWPSWWTLNLKTSYALYPGLTVQVGIDNMLDVHYRPFSSRISAPGRNVSLTLRGSF